MFATFYKLQEQPFGVNPDPRYLYLSKTHREVFSSLLYRIQTDCGFLAMLALPGMGKTTLLFHLLSQLQTTARTAFVFQTQCSSNEFLRYLLSEFGCSGNTTDPVRMFQELKTILLAEANAGRRCIVLVDEAQNLQAEVLETIRLLSDFETPRRKLLQIILSGQLELEDKLSHPGLSQLRQRLSSITRLQQFGTEDTILYIAHRLKVAGHNGDLTSLFDRPALARIVIFGGGIPRIINNVCFNALSLGFAVGANQIDSSIIEEVAGDLGINESLQTASTLLSEIECMLPVVSQPREELSHYEDRQVREVYAVASARQGAAGSPEPLDASPQVTSNPSPDGGLGTRIAEVGAQADIAVAAFAQTCVSPEEPEVKPKVETAKKAAPVRPVPVQIAADIFAAKVRTEFRRSRDSLTPPKRSGVKAGRGIGVATALILLLGIGVLEYVEHRGAESGVEAKSTAQMPGRLRSSGSLPATTTGRLEFARPHGTRTHVSSAPFTAIRPQATELAPASSNHERQLAIRASDLKEKLLALSQLPENLLQTQTVVPAAATFTITGTPPALQSPVTHVLTLPTLKDPPPSISAPATRILRPSESSYVPPRAISRRPPVYPDFAKVARLQGDVMLLLSISRTGDVQNATVVNGNTFLAAAAEDAALHWSYEPGLRNGIPTESQMQVVVRFRLQ
jgi:general secretion pathway protein A